MHEHLSVTKVSEEEECGLPSLSLGQSPFWSFFEEGWLKFNVDATYMDGHAALAIMAGDPIGRLLLLKIDIMVADPTYFSHRTGWNGNRLDF